MVLTVALAYLVAVLGRGQEGHEYTEEDYFRLLLLAAVRGTTLEGARAQLKNGPAANTVLHYLRRWVVEDPPVLADLLNKLLVADLPAGILGGRLKGAMDWIDLPYYGREDPNNPYICRMKAKDGTTYCFRYATCYVIKHNKRVTLAVTAVRRGESLVAVLKRLLGRVQELGVTVTRLYLDKGFCNGAVLRSLRRQRIPHAVPLPVRGQAGGVRSLFYGRQGYRTYYTLHSPKYGNLRVPVWVACTYSKGKHGRRGVEYFAYVIYDIPDGSLHQLHDDYRHRFGVEASYRLMNQVRVRTTVKAEKSAALRLLFVGVGFFLLNLWVSLKWQRVSQPRRGGRRVYHDLFTLERLRTFLQTAIEGVYGVVDAVYLPEPEPRGQSPP
jgi:putative transposase